MFVPPASIAWLKVDGHGALTEFAYVDQPFQADLVQNTREQTVCVRVFKVTPEGIAWWAENGRQINLEFDLAEGSYSRRTWDNYLKAKAEKKKEQE